jgi:hypothetical protein
MKKTGEKKPGQKMIHKPDIKNPSPKKPVDDMKDMKH